MNKLLNSAMMPNLDAVYDCRSCGPQEFARYLQGSPFESFVGYPETARILEELTGLTIPISRAQTTVQSGDILLIARLKYRMNNPAQKGQTQHTLDDFEFAVCEVE